LKIISLVGAKPNFMKIASFIKAIEKWNFELQTSNSEPIKHLLVHTGQHYDDRMSRAFFGALRFGSGRIG
jgi:UDP-N-acetylglucosamine 2-epimerase (non-hydrolysing)